MKLIDTDETVVVVTGSDLRAEERDRPIAYRLKEEIDRRGAGHAFRRAVVVGDTWFLGNRIFHLNPTIAIGGPGVNGLSQQCFEALPTIWTQDERIFVQADFEAEAKRASLWGVDAAATAEAAVVFIREGFLDELLRRIWRFRAGVMV
ncbi:MAG: hypothetical protein ACREMO_00920 [Gemmatimonadales bacterium]